MQGRRIANMKAAKAAVGFGIVCVAYLASYPLAMKVIDHYDLVSIGVFEVAYGNDVPFYCLADYAIDYTSVRHIFLWWSECLGNRDYMEAGIRARESTKSAVQSEPTEWVDVH